MISPVPPNPNPMSAPSLDDFVRQAHGAEQVIATPEGNRWTVIAVGKTPSGREVLFVDPQVDSTALLLRALADRYGPIASQIAARELGLGPARGVPVAARVVESAVRLGADVQSALAGVDFVTRLAASAVRQGHIFRECCEQLGMAPSSLGLARREALDRDIERRIVVAQAQGAVPIAPPAVRAWLLEALQDEM
jgi:hypothetical protein